MQLYRNDAKPNEGLVHDVKELQSRHDSVEAFPAADRLLGEPHFTTPLGYTPHSMAEARGKSDGLIEDVAVNA